MVQRLRTRQDTHEQIVDVSKVLLVEVLVNGSIPECVVGVGYWLGSVSAGMPQLRPSACSAIDWRCSVDSQRRQWSTVNGSDSIRFVSR